MNSGEHENDLITKRLDGYNETDDDIYSGVPSYYSGYGEANDEMDELFHFDEEKPLAAAYPDYDETPLTKGDSDYLVDSGLGKTDSLARVSGRRETIMRMAKEYAEQNEVKQKKGKKKQTRNVKQKQTIVESVKMEGILGAPKRRKSVFSPFYTALALLGIGVCLTVMVVVAQNFLDNPPEIAALPTPTPTPAGITVPSVTQELRSQTALVENITVTGNTRTLTLMDVSTRLSRSFTVSEASIIQTRLGSPMTFNEIRVGHILDIRYEARSLEIMNIGESAGAWERRSRTNVMVDMDAATVSIGNETWRFNSQTLVLYQGRTFPISQIRPIDSVTVAGFGDTAWFVQVDAAHGFMRFTNTDMVSNGTLRIGTNLFFSLADMDEPIMLIEGTHLVVVEGSNIETFTQNVVVEQGRITSVNLANVQFRTAFLSIIVNPIDADVFLNGELHDLTLAAVVEFGEHHIRVEREGFIPQEQTVVISGVDNFASFVLEEIVIDSSITIFTVPTNAEIFINNIFVGYSTHTAMVRPGTHRITARMQGFNDAHYEVTLGSGDSVTRHMMLNRATGDPLDGMPPPPVHTPLPTLPPPMPGPTPQPAEPTPTPAPGTGFEIVPLPTLPPDNPFEEDYDE